MNILYHLSILPPKIAGSEAVTQEIAALQQHFGGQIVYLNPNGHLPFPIIPRVWFGFHQLGRLRNQQRRPLLHHVFNPDPFPFPVLRCLKRPVVYSLTGGVTDRHINRRFFASLAAVTVSDERSLKRLQAYGLDNVHRVPPGIDKRRFTHTPLPLTSEIRLMVGSSPWSRAQFRSKGIDALLETARYCPELRLIFLWRGVLFDEMWARVRRLGIEQQVEVLNEHVDVNAALARVHASICLTDTPPIIRPYPHSLLESLAAGKPVLLSRCIPMADYVATNGCGRIVEQLDVPHIIDAVLSLRSSYAELCQAAQRAGVQDFEHSQMLAGFAQVYERVWES